MTVYIIMSVCSSPCGSKNTKYLKEVYGSLDAAKNAVLAKGYGYIEEMSDDTWHTNKIVNEKYGARFMVIKAREVLN